MTPRTRCYSVASLPLSDPPSVSPHRGFRTGPARIRTRPLLPQRPARELQTQLPQWLPLLCNPRSVAVALGIARHFLPIPFGPSLRRNRPPHVVGATDGLLPLCLRLRRVHDPALRPRLRGPRLHVKPPLCFGRRLLFWLRPLCRSGFPPMLRLW